MVAKDVTGKGVHTNVYTLYNNGKYALLFKSIHFSDAERK